MTQQIIDSKTGALKLTNDFVVSQKTKPEQIISYFVRKNLEIRDMQNGRKQYFVRNVKVNETYITIIFFFENELLIMLSFIVSDKSIAVGSWDDWSEKKEIEKRDYYDMWLTKEIGKQRKFPWGTIDTSYDAKGGGSNIILKYI